MNIQLELALRVWRDRRIRTAGDRAFFAYAALLIALIVVVPISRVLWLGAISEPATRALASVAAPESAAIAAALLWSGALLLGRDRGPALLAPFLTHALATSELSRARVFRGQMLRAALLPAALTSLAATLVAGSLLQGGLTDPLSAAMFVAVGALVGIIAAVAWLAGQSFPRAALVVAGVVGLWCVAAQYIPALLPFTPWGWVGLAFPGRGTPIAAIALLALAAVLVALVPTFLNRMRLADLTVQAARWEAATSRTLSMELGQAAALYQHLPHAGRRFNAIRPARRLPNRMLLRDAIGASRTPARLTLSVFALAAAGIAFALAFGPAEPNGALGAAAGLLLYLGLGPVTDGIRHAASVAADFPMYGISDERLVGNHLLFPLAVLLIVLCAALVGAALATGAPVVISFASSLVAGLTALALRVSTALKGPMPASLLTPLPTPAGDLSLVVQLTWALDGLILATAAGAAAVFLIQLPMASLGIALVVVGVGLSRWRRR